MTKQPSVRVALVVPHLFMGDALRGQVIFSPGELAREFANAALPGVELTLFTPLPVRCRAQTVTADAGGFERELAGRGYGYLTLLKKHPSLFVALSRQLQGEVIAEAFRRANADEFDLVHIYSNEEDQALIFADLCRKPVVFTHHDPYNFLIKYKSVFPRYRQRYFVSMSLAQQRTAPPGTNFVANIYHGVRLGQPSRGPKDYFLYAGRVIQPKGVEWAIAAAERNGVPLKIVGKRYDDDYFEQVVAPHLGGQIEFLGFKRGQELMELMAGARALLMPSQFAEPFGLAAIEALAVGTPVIASRQGALPEIIEDGKSGFLVENIDEMAAAMLRVSELKSADCLARVREQFSLERMLVQHAELWRRMAGR